MKKELDLLGTIAKNTTFEKGGGAYANIDYEVFSGRKSVKKKYNTPNLDIPINYLVDSLLEYRDRLQTFCTIPDLFDLQITSDTGFFTIEQRVEGASGHQITERKNPIEIKAFAIEIFSRIFPFKESQVQLAKGIKSYFPLIAAIDTKPNNYIVSSDDGALYYVDHFPPRNRGIDGLVHPFSEFLSVNTQEVQTMLYGDAAFQYLHFWSHALFDHEKDIIDKARKAADYASHMKELAMDLDPSGKFWRAVEVIPKEKLVIQWFDNNPRKAIHMPLLQTLIDEG